MELATADAVQPLPGEAAFILQLRPPVSGRADALASELDRFTSLYLERAPGEQVRFSPLGALTWALCAPVDAVDAVDAACDALAQTLFGDPASDYVHLARQPDQPRKEDYNIQDQALSEEEGEAVMQDLAEHEWDFAGGEAEGEASESADDSVAALDDETVDLDAFEPPAGTGDADDWQFEDPLQDASNLDVIVPSLDEIEPAAAATDAVDAAEEIDLDAFAESEADPVAEREADAEAEPVFDAEEAIADAPDIAPDAGLVANEEDDLDFELAVPESEDTASSPDMDFDLSVSEPVMEAETPDSGDAVAFEDADVATEAFEEAEDPSIDLASEDVADSASEPDVTLGSVDEEDPAPEGDLALDDFVLEDEDAASPQTGIWDEDVDTVDIDDIAASALHETRLGSNLDVAAELNAFREEMRAIARSIPSGGLDDTLSEFRAGLESLSGELGQRVDGAAQRIEAAVGQLDVGRYDAASQRVESAAALMETSIQDALEALKAAGAAMSAPTASDMLAAQDRETL